MLPTRPRPGPPSPTGPGTASSPASRPPPTWAATPGTGLLTTAITSRSSGIKDLQDQIDSWDIRLALKKQNLQTQFTNLETAMSQMQSQSQWLAAQLAGLATHVLVEHEQHRRLR